MSTGRWERRRSKRNWKGKCVCHIKERKVRKYHIYKSQRCSLLKDGGFSKGVSTVPVRTSPAEVAALAWLAALAEWKLT
jgi:hypothetical protein